MISSKAIMITTRKIGLWLAAFAVVVGISLVAKGTAENYFLKKIIERLEADSIVAKITVTNYILNPWTKKFDTTIKFVEVDRDGADKEAKYYRFSDDLIQFQSLVIRFNKSYVKNSDMLKGKSIYLVLRAFSTDGKKIESFDITPINSIPDGYKVKNGSEYFEKIIWKRFWKYALNPEEAKRVGIAVAQVEAPGTRFVPGLLYILKIDHAAGLKIETERLNRITK